MAVTTEWYRQGFGNFVGGVANGSWDWDTDDIKIALLTGHTPDLDNHDFFNDVEADEISGTNYTAGGASLDSQTVTVDDASDEIRLDAADEAWASASFSADSGVIYKDAGGATSADPLIGYIDFDGTQTVSSGTFTIVFDSTGVLKADATLV